MHPPGAPRRRWLAHLLSTDPADRPRAEAAVRDLYGHADFPAPRHLIWFDSPIDAAWAVALLIESRHAAWQPLVAAARGSRTGRERIARVEAALCRMCGASAMTEALAAFGRPRGMSLQFMPSAESTFSSQVFAARVDVRGGDVSSLFKIPDGGDPLSQAEQRLWTGSRSLLQSSFVCPTTGPLLAQSFFNDYTFSSMAADEEAADGRQVPPLLRAAWTIAQSAGPWWPFESGAILMERPSELHVDDAGLPHRADGPAIVWRDGSKAYAWRGLAVPEDWILHPESVPPAKLRGFDPSFQKHATSRRASAPARPKPAKPSPILNAPLPTDPAELLQLLRTHAGGSLPLYGRYVAGDHTAVWTELVAHGAAVRTDPFAADALAVAYETMTRVETNVRTLVTRLLELGYQFTTPEGRKRPPKDAHVPPGPRDRKRLRQLEKEAGPLPLSLRAFYDVVGAVNLIGRHPTLTPTTGVVAPDPLVVVGIEELLSEIGSWDDEEAPLMLAPDDLHKSGTSGGDPYAMEVPNPAADGILLNEGHELLFVDYLRLCFRFGGFPGYEGREDVPGEIERLRADLLSF